MSGRIFAGREAMIRDVLEAVGGSEPLTVFVVYGVGGVGKTALLKELARRLAPSTAKVLRVNFDEFASPDRKLDDGELLTTYREILESLARQLDPARAPDFCRHARRSAAGATSRVAVDAARDDIRDAFIEMVATPGSPVVILGDDVSALGADTLADWLLQLLRETSRETRLVAVLSRSAPPPERIQYPGQVSTIALGALERGEARALLAGSGADERWLDAIERWCGFYPAAVVAGAEIAAARPDRPDVLDDDGELAARHAPDLVDVLMTSLPGEAEQRLLEVAAVTRHFDTDLLKDVLPERLAPPPDLDSWLAGLPFIERHGRGRYRVRPFLRSLLPTVLRKQRPRDTTQLGSRLDELHDLVARYYAERVREKAHARSYRSWVTIEDRAAQQEQLEFIHHALKHADKRFGRFSIAEAYFDAFWWWGAYVESDFCRRLLDAAEQEGREDDRPFLTAMRRFEGAYPPETSGAEADWPSARAAIEEIKRQIGIDEPATRLARSEPHVRAILDVLLGEAHTAIDPQAQAAEDCFESAYRLFEQNRNDRWCLPWVRLYECSLAAARGRHANALDLARKGLALAMETREQADRDFEVEARLHRAIADVYWQRGERRTAFGHLAKAVFLAYSFTSIPQPPDEYTRLFYQDVSGTAVDRIFELLPDYDEARRACDGFVKFWKPYWDDVGGAPEEHSVDSLLRTNARDVALCVLPAGPTDDDLEHEGPYTERVRAAHERLRDSLDEAVEGFGRERIARRLLGAIRFGPPGSVDAVHVEPPREPAEPADLFEPSDDPVWPDHWRTFPEAWRTLREDGPELAEAQAVIDRTVEALPPVWREVLQRRDGDGWTYEEVARRLGVARADQTVMLHHSRARIRAALASHFVDDRA